MNKKIEKINLNKIEGEEKEWVVKDSWKNFRETGLFWWINMILHTFGWSLVIEFDNNNEIIECYPARVKFRGFSEEQNTKGYQMVSDYMSKYGYRLKLEAEEKV